MRNYKQTHRIYSHMHGTYALLVCISRFYCKTKMRNTRRKQFGANHTLFKSANDNRNSGIVKPSDKISKVGYTSIWYFKELWNISFIFCQICIARLYIIFWVFIRDFFASSECVFMFFCMFGSQLLYLVWTSVQFLIECLDDHFDSDFSS